MPDDLPDDPKRWPSDPFALLGIDRGAPDTDIRRAYTRLIRRFKPEHHPEQFRLVRDAYEVCRVQSPWFRQDDTDAADAADVRHPEPVPDEPVFARHTDEADPVASTLARHDAPRDPVPDCWDRLARGPDPAAFAELLAAAETQPARVEVSLRLYWLLAFDPTLDPHRGRHHWLARALRQSRFQGSAMELYRRELEADPATAFDGPYRDLFADSPNADLSGIAVSRIAAAGRAVRWDTMADDLAAAGLLLRDDEPGWLSVLVAAHDWAAWAPPNRALDRVVDELTALRHLELRHSWSFDRIEYVRAASSAARATDLPPSVLALVRATVATEGDPTATEVENAAAAVTADASGAWRAFDSAARGLVPEVVVGAFETYLRRSREDDEYPADLIRAAAARLWRHAESGYPRWRAHLLDFLREERLDPLEFASAFQNDNSRAARAFARQVASDAGLRAVWLAFRIVEA